MSKVTPEDIQKLARLSALSVSRTEAEHLARDLSAIVGYVEQLAAVDTTSLEPTYQVTGLQNVERPDEVTDYSDLRHGLLDANVPNLRPDGHIGVGRVLK